MPTEWAFELQSNPINFVINELQPLFPHSNFIGITTTEADQFAATIHHPRLFFIDRYRQTTNRAVPEAAALGLLEQNLVS